MFTLFNKKFERLRCNKYGKNISRKRKETVKRKNEKMKEATIESHKTKKEIEEAICSFFI